MSQVVFAGPMPLAGSFHLRAERSQFQEWNEADHQGAYSKMMGAASRHGQFLVHGRVRAGEDFKWTFIPYEDCTWTVGRIAQQMQVLHALTFGGMCRTESLTIPDVEVLPAGGEAKGDDAFCKKDVISRQLVCEGERVNLLFNYAPIGKAHFLIVPNNHRERFHDLTQDEYVEACQMAQKVASVYAGKTIYIHHKTGKDAGQTVNHWHIHVIVLDNVAEELTSRLHVLYKMLMPVSPLNSDALARRISELPDALKKREEAAV